MGCYDFFFIQSEHAIPDVAGIAPESSDFFFSSRRRHTRCSRDWSSDVCSSDLKATCKATCFEGFEVLAPKESRERPHSRLRPQGIRLVVVLACLQLAVPEFAFLDRKSVV